MPPEIQDITDQILQTLGQHLLTAGLDTFTPAQQELIHRCCADAAALQVRALASPPTSEAQLSLLREKAHLNAQLSNLAAAAESAAFSKLFWKSVQQVAQSAVAVAFAAL